MKTDKLYVSLKLAKPKLNIDMPIGLPDKCAGIVFVWKTKKAGREFEGKDTKFLEVTLDEPKGGD